MKQKKIAELRKRIKIMRNRGGVASRGVERIATAVGRKRASQGQGKEPMWINMALPQRRALAIPHHSVPLKRFTKNSILDILEGDLDAYEEENVNAIERKNGHP